MLGLNMNVLSGNVGSVKISKTSTDVTAFSMLVAIDIKNGETLWIRVNVYGSLGKKCADNIDKGDFVVVVGELMERKKSDNQVTFIEIRAKEVIFGSSLKKDTERVAESIGSLTLGGGYITTDGE